MRALLLAATLLTGAPAHAGFVVASYYDCRTLGQCRPNKLTASGEKFNAQALTAAHRTLPFGTRVRVTHGPRSVIVRINDRGPFIAGRTLDLSRGAAQAIGITGVQRVHMVVVS